MLNRLLILALVMLLGSFNAASAQAPVKAVKFDYLEKLMQIQTDTLYVVNFWATWCKPCVAELPGFEKVSVANKQKNVKFIFVSLDFAEDLNKKLIPFVKKKNISSEVVLLDETDYNAWIDKVDPSWQGDIPATLIFNNKKNSRAFYAKELTEQELSVIINKNLN